MINPEDILFIGVVGHGQDKFNAVTKTSAIDIIQGLLGPEAVIVSGHSPMGGIDIWAENMAFEANRSHGYPKPIIHAPKVFGWGPTGGYKQRNIKIATGSNVLHVIVVSEYPSGYKGPRYGLCYHCKNRITPHVKSGGCWTGWYAVKLGRNVIWSIIYPDGSVKHWMAVSDMEVKLT